MLTETSEMRQNPCAARSFRDRPVECSGRIRGDGVCSRREWAVDQFEGVFDSKTVSVLGSLIVTPPGCAPPAARACGPSFSSRAV